MKVQMIKIGITTGLLAMLLSTAPLAQADSLFTAAAERGGTLVAEKINRFEVGDIITVMVREKLDATTSADTSTKKESGVDNVMPTASNGFLTNTKEQGGFELLDPGKLPNWSVEAENETKNRGTTRRSNTLNTEITCTVMEVLKNGNLKINGKKNIMVNREDSTLSLSGIIRAKDVTQQNTIESAKLADSDLKLMGRGPLWNNQRRGLLTKLTDWFSPF